MTDSPQNGSTSGSETWSALLFWFVILVIIAFFYFRKDQADVLFNVLVQPESVSGIVTFAGAPVHGGVVHIVVSDARNKRYLAGATLSVSDDGKFTSQKGQHTLHIIENRRPLRISASFLGTLVKKEKNDSEVKPLSGESVLYLNTSPPLGEHFVWGVASAAAVLLVSLLVLFTGDLDQLKARGLFMLMYFFTFFSLAVPVAISLVVAQNPYLVESMEASPIGLVKAKTAVLGEPQWLVNIGGVVGTTSTPTSNSTDAAAATSAATEAQRRTTQASAGDSTDAAGAETETSPETGANGNHLVAATADATSSTKIVEGGLAVPFYVILLAMFGAGINMTLKVPEIQRSYEDVLSAGRFSWLNPLAVAWRLLQRQRQTLATKSTTDVPSKTAADIRRELIENYMYLLSAPFLAIAMYYLLQVLAEQVTQSVLVLMAFATGLVSKAVIRGIIDFAESRLPSETRHGELVLQPSKEVTAKVAEAKARQAEAEAAGRAVDEARAKQSAAETTAKTAEEAAHTARQKLAAIEAAAGGGEAKQVDVDTAKEEAGKAEQEAAAKRAEVEKAAAAVAQAERETETKRAAAQVAIETTGEVAKAAMINSLELEQ